MHMAAIASVSSYSEERGSDFHGFEKNPFFIRL